MPSSLSTPKPQAMSFPLAQMPSRVQTHVALPKQAAPLRLQANSQQRSERLPLARPQRVCPGAAPSSTVPLPRRERHGVQVDDGKQQPRVARCVVLHAGPLPQRAQVVAQVRHPCRLDAREHHRPGREALRRRGWRSVSAARPGGFFHPRSRPCQ